jgi:RPA family protein
MAEQEIKRQTAYKCNIHTINTGILIKKQGWESNYLMTEYGDFSRINIIAVVVGKDENNVILDDGTGQISGRLFERIEQLTQITVGDIVLVIARPREYDNKMYLTIEIIKKTTPGWVIYRRKELLLIQKIRDLKEFQNIEKKSPEADIVESSNTLNSKDKIAKLIKELDRGMGANIDDIIRLSKSSNSEDIISDMLMRGEAYESKAGYLKLM